MIINRREFLQTAGAASAATASSNLALGADKQGSSAKPNILIVVCDQMNLDAISAYQRFFDHNAWLTHWVDTPNLDDLVHNGVSFTELKRAPNRALRPLHPKQSKAQMPLSLKKP